jgi:hypothetical protein
MERIVKVDNSDLVSYKLNNHQSQTQFTLGLYVDMNSASGGLLVQQLSMLTLKYRNLTIYYCTSADRYINGGQHTLPYYELYQLNEKIAERTAIGHLFVNELKTFIETHLSH